MERKRTFTLKLCINQITQQEFNNCSNFLICNNCNLFPFTSFNIKHITNFRPYSMSKFPIINTNVRELAQQIFYSGET